MAQFLLAKFLSQALEWKARYPTSKFYAGLRYEPFIYEQARKLFPNYSKLYPDNKEFTEKFVKDLRNKETALLKIINPDQLSPELDTANIQFETEARQEQQVVAQTNPQEVTQPFSLASPPVPRLPLSPRLSTTTEEKKETMVSKTEQAHKPRFQVPKIPSGITSFGQNLGSTTQIGLKKGLGRVGSGLGSVFGGVARGGGGVLVKAGGFAGDTLARASNQISRGGLIKGPGKAIWAFVGAFFLLFIIGSIAIPGLPTGTPTGETAPISGSACDVSGFDPFDANAVTDEVLNKFIDREKNPSWVVKGSTQENFFESRTRFIRDTAKVAGLNPAIFLGLWRSESSYSNDRFRRGNDLGCRPDNPEITTFEEDVLCAVGTKSPAKTYEPSYTTKCLLSRDVNSSSCQVIKPTADKEGFALPISSLDSYLKAYAPLAADPNNINTHRIVKQVISEMGLAKCTPSTASSTGSLAEIVQWAQRINDALQPGLPPSSYNKMLADISNGTYSATKRSAQDRGVGPTGIYWCTNIVIDSYNLANTKGLNTNHQAVRGMMDFWKKTSGYIFQPYPGTDLKLVQAGFALFRINPDWNLDHVSIIESIKIDHRGEGSIKTLDSNGFKGWSSTIENGKIFETSFDKTTSIVGFGGIVGSANRGSGTAAKPVIVLDPGHSGSDINIIDPTTGLQDHDYPNTPEIEEVFTVAQQVKDQLEADGYTVVMTKSSVNDNVSLRKRADIANNAGASLAVSIHSDHGAKWDNFAQIYVQKKGLYRERSDRQRITFDDETVAEKSQKYGQIFTQERSAAEGRAVSVTDISFTGRPGLAAGNIPLVQLFAKVPWVYNEVGAEGANQLSQEKLNIYAQGIINGIKKSVPIRQP